MKGMRYLGELIEIIIIIGQICKKPDKIKANIRHFKLN